MYINASAVCDEHFRQAGETVTIEHPLKVAACRGASSTHNQADYIGAPAAALYTKPGACQEVLYFDIAIKHSLHTQSPQVSQA